RDAESSAETGEHANPVPAAHTIECTPGSPRTRRASRSKRGGKTPPVRLGRGSVVLAGLVLASTALRAWAGRAVTTPWISPDEPAYALLGRRLYATGRLRILNGPTGFLSATAPALFGLPLSLGN